MLYGGMAESDYRKVLKLSDVMNTLTPMRLSQNQLVNVIPCVSDLKILKDTGYLIQALDSTKPTLRSIVSDLLMEYLPDDVFENLVSSFSNLKERYLSEKDTIFVHFFTTSKFADFNKLAQQTNYSEDQYRESTVTLKCLYTNDPKLGSADLDSDLNIVKYSEKWIYLIDSYTQESFGNNLEFVRDYMIYLPYKYLR